MNVQNIALSSTNVDFINSDEYDVVSTRDLVLMSDESLVNIVENDAIKEKILQNSKLTSAKQYLEEWNDLFSTGVIDIDKLKFLSSEGKLKISNFRSVCWRILLEILHKQPCQWLCQLQTYRKHYDEVCVELDHNPWNIDGYIPQDNPLSQESESIWQKYFCNEELKAVISQDVKRTFPDLDYFRNEEVQKTMVRVLFCYARQNPLLCYRQGMHEILAPIILVLHCDHLAFLHFKEKISSLNNDMCEILNPDYLEQDSFSIFKNVMSHIQCNYKICNTSPTLTGECTAENQIEESIPLQTEATSRLDYICKNIFQQNDPELCEHLLKLDIPMHLFGIRWLRLLFGRELPLQDLLTLWDFIFANNFDPVNYIVVALLVAIRQILLAGDYNSCLSTLMRYPSGVNVNYIIKYALHLKNPQKYHCPNASLVKTAIQHYKRQDTHSQLKRLKNVYYGSPQFFQPRPSQLLLGQVGGRDDIARGYVLDNFSLLKMELDQTKVVMDIVYHKLLQFHSILSVNLNKQNSLDVKLVMDGIQELTCLLKRHYKENFDVETACEAGETKEKDELPPHIYEKPKIEISMKDKLKEVETMNRSHTLPRMRRNHRSGELTVFKQYIGEPLSHVPMIDPLHLIKD